MTAFGQVLRDMRSSLGLSQTDLALHLGTTQRHLSFLETGRSEPTKFFVTRLCRELNVSLAQRANLFNAAGLPETYPQRSMTSPEIHAALDTISTLVLNNWPFPAMVMDPAWSVLRANDAYWTLFAPFISRSDTNSHNLAKIMIQPEFRKMIVNWADVAELFYYRLQLAAARHDEARDVFAYLKQSGLFDDMPKTLEGPAPIFVPVELRFPDGTNLRLTSLVGHLMAVQDPGVEGLEIEFFVPLDAETEATLHAL